MVYLLSSVTSRAVAGIPSMNRAKQLIAGMTQARPVLRAANTNIPLLNLCLKIQQVQSKCLTKNWLPGI